jgi:hypothetical protein
MREIVRWHCDKYHSSALRGAILLFVGCSRSQRFSSMSGSGFGFKPPHSLRHSYFTLSCATSMIMRADR